VLRKTLDILQGRIVEQYGEGKSFGALFYEHGLAHHEVRESLAGGPTERESTRNPKR
jgi:hypothetical protein